MMTQKLGFSVLTAPIAAIDRRSLSQAWYSALHLARQSPQHEPSPFVCAPQADAERKLGGLPQARTRSAVAPLAQTVQRCVHRSRGEAAPMERRSSRSPLARKIEHMFLRPNHAVTRATFTIDGSSARVQISMQQTRSGLRLVAVCPARTRESVARALEQARYALAARGIAVDSHITE